MTQLRSEIIVQVKDQDAQQALDKLIQKLERARDLASEITPGGGGPGGGGPGGGGDGSGSDRGGASRDRGGPSGGGRVRGSFTERAVKGFGQAAQKGTGMLVGGRSNPAFAINLFGKAVSDSMDALTAGLLEIAKTSSKALESIPFAGAISGIGGIGAVAAKVGTTIMSEAVQARFEQAMSIASLERPMEQARIAGGGSSSRNLAGRGPIREGARWGFRAQESAQMMSQFSRSIGVAGGAQTALGAGVNPFEATASNLSPEMIARYISLGGPGGGATQGVGGASHAVQTAIGTLYQEGLRGAKVDEALARIASSTTQMAEQGLSLDLVSTNRFMAGLSQTGDRQRSLTRGRNVFAGMHGVRGAASMSGIGQGAAKGLAGGFGGYADAIIQAAAFKQAGDPLEAIELIEQWSEDPSKIAEIVRSGAPDSLSAGMAFVGTGRFSGAQSRVLGRGIDAGVVGAPTSGGADPSQLPISRQLAENERRLMENVAGNPAGVRAMLDAMTTINDTLINIGLGATPFLRSVDQSLKTLVSDAELKTEIVELEHSPYQVPLYSWTWTPQAAELFGLVGSGTGVLAQDVLQVQPEAVFMDAGTGSFRVAYDWLHHP